MTPAPHAARLLTTGGVLLLAGVLTGRIELVAMGAPFLVLLVAGSRRAGSPPGVSLTLSHDLVREGDDARVTVTIEPGGTPVAAVEVEVRLPPGMTVVSGSSRFVVDAPRRTEVTFTVRPGRWGMHRIGPLIGTAYGPGRLAAAPLRRDAVPLRVLPDAERFDAEAAHPFTRVLSGTHVARAAGTGVEFEGIREFRPGDRLRRVNWRVSARTGELHVTQHRPERNAEVVVLLDTFVDRGPPGQTTLDIAVRAGYGIATYYLDQADRVGIVGFGGIVRWLYAGTGRMQRYAVAEHLLGTAQVQSWAWRDVDVIPPRALPPRALVIALSPLLDTRTAGVIADLARRGYGVVVVDVAPTPLLPVATRAYEALARRVYVMEREALVQRLSEIGVPVVRWTGPGSLDAVLGEIARLHARPRVVNR